MGGFGKSPLEFNMSGKKSQSPEANRVVYESPDFTIEQASEKDWEICRKIRLMELKGEDKEMFGPTPEKIKEEEEKTEKEYKKELSSKSMFTFLSKVNSEPVGMGRAIETKRGVWNLRNAYVIDPELRGKGIGKKNFEMRLEEVKKLKAKKAFVGIHKDNKESTGIAESFGFTELNEEDALKYVNKEALEKWKILALDLTKKEDKV